MSDSKSFGSRNSAAFLREQRRTEPGWCWPGQRESSPGNPWRGATAAIKGRGNIFKDMWFSAAFGLVGLATDVVSFLFERGFLRCVIISKIQNKSKTKHLYCLILPSFYFIFHCFCFAIILLDVLSQVIQCTVRVYKLPQHIFHFFHISPLNNGMRDLQPGTYFWVRTANIW